jgi:hypothetical protein
MQAWSTLLEVQLEGGILERPLGLDISPGQYLLALPSALFPTHMAPEWIAVAAPLPTDWRAGQAIAIRAPLGKGFQLPSTARRVAVAALDHSPARLLTLVTQALAHAAEVCLYTLSLPSGLPEAVEVQSPDQLPEAWKWADYLALDCPLSLRTRWEQILPDPRPYRLLCPTQILVYTQMPCGGQAECGVCAVETHRGWLHACKNGPVFDLQDLV